MIPFEQSRLKQLPEGENYTHKKFLQLLQNPQINNSFGSVVGSWIGDSLGSYCEFSPTQVSQERLDEAMQMNGGGPFKILPGQFTDDSQMSVALIQGLLSYNQSQGIKQQKLHILSSISKQYVAWLDSDPFDIGQTCFNALYTLKKEFKNNKKDYDQQRLDRIKQEIFFINGSKQSNGSLMRNSPMNMFYSLYQGQKQDIKELISNEIQLTHPNKKLVQTGIDWVELNTEIINRNSKQSKIKNIYQQFIHKQKSRNHNLIDDYIQQGMRQEFMGGVYQMGWAKIAFSYSINQLRFLANKQEKIIYQNSQKIYKDVLRKVMKQGGDTDTNCAIVGSIVGSIIGFKGLPQEYVHKMINLNLSFDKNQTQSAAWNRPLNYEPRRAFLSVLKLIGKLNPKYKII